jgi:transcriptional regulator with XRE-family HTH domain
MSPKAANSIDAHVAGRLRTYRRQLGLSQADVAKQLGVTFQQIQKYEAGINRVGAGRLFQLALLYGMPIGDFFPNSPVSADGARCTAKTEEIAAFATSPDGFRLCEAFIKITNNKQRRMVISLIEDMAEQ